MMGSSPVHSGKRASVLALAGPTAAGKSELALQIAEELGCEIICCDAMQVYRRMDIGTAKPGQAERSRVPHHCLDLVETWEQYSVADYQSAARSAIADVCVRGRTPLLVGGSGLYLRAAVDDISFAALPDPCRRGELESRSLPELVARLELLDPGRAARVDLANPRRVVRAIELAEDLGPGRGTDAAWHERRSVYDLTLAVICPVDRADLYGRIDARVDAMIAAGWLDEVRDLAEDGRPLARTACRAIGYAELRSVLAGDYSLDDAVEIIKRRTRVFARRQLTWFRRDHRAQWFCGAPGSVHTLVASAFGGAG